MTSEQPLHLHEEPLLTTAPESIHAPIDSNALITKAITSLQKTLHSKPNQIDLDTPIDFQFQPFQSAFNQFRFKPLPAKSQKLATNPFLSYAKQVKVAPKPTKLVPKPANLVAKPTKVVVAKNVGKIFPDAYINLDSFFKDNKLSSQSNYAKQFGFYRWK